MSKLDYNKNLWMVRGDVDYFLENNIVAIYFDLFESAAKYENAQEIKDKNPNLSYGAHHQLFRFYKEIKKGDYVVVYDKSVREYILGEVSSEYKFRLKDGSGEHYRSVKFFKEKPIPRDSLSSSAKHGLGGMLTLTKVREDVKKELFDIFSGHTATQTKTDQGSEEEKFDYIGEAREAVKELILKISSEDMERFIAGLFRAMGYKTRMRGAHTSADGGYDIVASKDGLGLDGESIFIEVKHRKEQMTASDVRRLRGALGNNKGVLFSSGGFSKDAKVNTHDIVLIDLEYLVDLIFEYYDKFDSETKNLLPLRKVYVPGE